MELYCSNVACQEGQSPSPGGCRGSLSGRGFLGKETNPRRDRGFPRPSDPFPGEKPLSAPAHQTEASFARGALPMTPKKPLPERQGVSPAGVWGAPKILFFLSLSCRRWQERRKRNLKGAPLGPPLPKGVQGSPLPGSGVSPIYLFSSLSPPQAACEKKKRTTGPS
jgi:hypothetical protein